MNALPEPVPFTAEGPQPLLREIPPGEPYPVHALGSLQQVVEAVQDISQAPIGIAAQSALAVASLVVQGFADVETLGGDAPLSLFCLTIAESGERKSTCDRLLMQGRAHCWVLMLWGNLDAPEVTPQAMGWGVTLAQFYLGEARRLAEAGAVSQETGRAEMLRRWLLESWPHEDITPREVLRFGPNSLRESKVAQAMLAVLAGHGWLVSLPEGTVIRGAARKEAWHIVRAAHAV